MPQQDLGGKRGQSGGSNSSSGTIVPNLDLPNEAASLSQPRETVNVRTSEAAADLKDVTSTVIRLNSFLSQFSHPMVRADFINGRFSRDIDRKIMPIIDELRWKLLPQWVGGALDCTTDRVDYTKVHLLKLIRRSEDVCEISCEGYRERSYAEVFTLLNAIANDCYWTEMPAHRRCIHATTDGDQADIKINAEKSSLRITKVEPSSSSGDSTKRAKIRSSKRKTKPKIEDIIVLSSDSESSQRSSSLVKDLYSETSSASSDSSRPISKRLRSRRRSREVVTPPVFEMDGKTRFEDFLTSFDCYFDAKFSGTSYDKTQKLSEFLTGDLRKVYDLKGGRRLKYSEMRKLLLEFYRKQKIGGKTHWRKLLSETTMNEDESYEIFGMRLADLVERAYPRDAKQAAKQLRSHFLSALPVSVVSKINDAERTLKATTRGKSKRLPFTELTRIATDIGTERTPRAVFRTRDGIAKPNCENCDYRNPAAESPVKHTAREFRSRVRFRETDRLPRSEGSATFFNYQTDNLTNSPVRCTYCKRGNHHRRDCWRANGSCLICGRDHIMTACPLYDPQFRSRTPSANRRPLNSEVSEGARTRRD